MATEQHESQIKLQAQPAAQPDLKPRGIGTAVILDWGVAVELGILAPFFALGVGPGNQLASFSTAGRVGAAVVALGLAVAAVCFGEALRRGYRPVWIAQIVLNVGLTFLGLAKIPDTLRSLQAGHAGTAVSTFVLLIISPIIAWMLSRASTRSWIAQTTSAAARKRHGGRWLALIIVYAIISGALIAFGPLY